MKKNIEFSIRLILTYIVFLVTGTLGGAFLYSIYKMSMFLVAGRSCATFSSVVFLDGIFRLFPIILVFSCLGMSFFMIRHSCHSWFPLISYSLLYVLSWFVLLPASISVYEVCKEKFSFVQVAPNISEGYFRETDDHYFYYSKVEDGNLCTGVCIDKAYSDGRVRTFKDVQMNMTSGGFADPLIMQVVKIPKGLNYIIWKIKSVNSLMSCYASRGRSTWIAFATVAFALLGVVFLRDISVWRLVNVVLEIGVSVCIVIFNVSILTGGRLSAFEGIFDRNRTDLDLSHPFLVVCNLLFFAGCLAFGILIYFLRRGDDYYLGDEAQ